jgi:hypothetical protein
MLHDSVDMRLTETDVNNGLKIKEFDSFVQCNVPLHVQRQTSVYLVSFLSCILSHS